MKRLLFVLAMISAGLCSYPSYAAAPDTCFANPAAVFAAHPNASHVRYSLRVKKSQRCWYADAFRTEANVNASVKPAPRHVARTAASRPAYAAAAGRLRATSTIAPAPQPSTTAAAPPSPPALTQFPSDLPPAILIAVEARQLSRLLLLDDTPADFESRFSGYQVRGETRRAEIESMSRPYSRATRAGPVKI
jgi:hypothetical protein